MKSENEIPSATPQQPKLLRDILGDAVEREKLWANMSLSPFNTTPSRNTMYPHRQGDKNEI